VKNSQNSVDSLGDITSFFWCVQLLFAHLGLFSIANVKRGRNWK